MLHATFSQLNLGTYMAKSEYDTTLNSEFERQSCAHIGTDYKMDVDVQIVEHELERKGFDFVMPLASSRLSKLRSPRKISPQKNFYPKPTPAPRSSMNSDSKMSSNLASNLKLKNDPGVFVKSLSEKLENLQEKDERKRFGDVKNPSKNLSHSRMEMLSSSTTVSPGLGDVQSHRMSVELRRLCSFQSDFNSDSDNSSCLYANTSYMSSTDFADDVFHEAKESGLYQSPAKSEFQDSLCQDVSIEFLEKDVIKGAAITGSPSKVRHSSSKAVRRVKSATAPSSCRYSPYSASPRKSPLRSPSGRRWFKAKTDPHLSYEDRLRDGRRFDSNILLTKRALHFDDESQTSQVPVQKLKSPHVPQDVRTDTPESGYGSLDTTRQTPDIAQNLTPVSCKSFLNSRSNAPFITPETTPRAAPTKINSCPIPWFEKFDIVSRLYKVEASIVDSILSYLEPAELVLFSSVSSQWRHMCSSFPLRVSLRDEFLEEQRQKFLRKKENVPSSTRATPRAMTRPGTPLASVQHLGKPTAESTPLRSSVDRFHEVGKQLPRGQFLDKCRCGSPARVETLTQRARCSSVHCQMEFCIKCHLGYHGNSPCTPHSVKGRPRGPSVGSQKSKRNLRRHSRLSSSDR